MRLPLTLALAGVLVLAAGALLAWAQAPRTVEVGMHYSRFVTGELTFAAGETVTFVIHNDDPIDHEFILGDEALQQRHETGTEPHHDSIPTEVSVAAGQTVETTVTFSEPGSLILGCHLPGHYAYGMRAEVIVRPG